MAPSSQGLRLVEDKSKNFQNYRRSVAELWPSELRGGHSLHYAFSYRGSFRPELAKFCINRYSRPGEVVLDPFCGRGTTLLEASLLGRVGWGADLSPLAVSVSKAKCLPVGLDEVVLQLTQINFDRPVDLVHYHDDLKPFFHPGTYRELVNLRNFIKQNPGRVAAFLELLALSRLHGHTPSYFSAYSAPQMSLSPERQLRLNRTRRQDPEYRAVAPRLIKRAAQTLQDGFSSEFLDCSRLSKVKQGDARQLDWVNDNSVDLIVTAPPAPDSINYAADHWLSFWFLGQNFRLTAAALGPLMDVESWKNLIYDSLKEILRVLKPGSYAVIALGEMETSNGGVLMLDEIAASSALLLDHKGKRFSVEEVLIHKQRIQERASASGLPSGDLGVLNQNRLLVLRAFERSSPRRLLHAN